MAAIFSGVALFELELLPGTRILDAGIPADPLVIRRLVREFGRGILESDPLHKVLPRNKHLTKEEMVALVRHNYAGRYRRPLPWNIWG